jgi:hypothetical protein
MAVKKSYTHAYASKVVVAEAGIGINDSRGPWGEHLEVNEATRSRGKLGVRAARRDFRRDVRRRSASLASGC